MRDDIIVQNIPQNIHTVFALLCFVVVIHWLIFQYPSGLLQCHCGNLTIAPVPAKQPWWIWINNSCEFIMNDCITTTKQSTAEPCAYFLGYTVIREWTITFISYFIMPVVTYPWLRFSDSDKESDFDKSIQQKYIRVPYEVKVSFLEIHITLHSWYINDYRHVRRPLLRSYTVGMESTRKARTCAAMVDTQ